LSYLLDTHALLWWLFDDPKLSTTARGIIADPAHAIFVSSASAWEIATKHRLGKLDSAAALLQDFPGYVRQAGLAELSITIPHAQRAGSWPQPHRDPFDRMIAAQAMLEGLSVLSRDEAIPQFGVTVVW
jgi:PIN domain nuclease of toxin-antitoxin system